MYYNVIKHSGHLGILEKCRKCSPAARVFFIYLVFSNARPVLSECNTRLRLLYLLNKELFPAFSCAYIEIWMRLVSLESTQEARVAQDGLTLLLCSPNFLCASITRYMHS